MPACVCMYVFLDARDVCGFVAVVSADWWHIRSCFKTTTNNSLQLHSRSYISEVIQLGVSDVNLWNFFVRDCRATLVIN